MELNLILYLLYLDLLSLHAYISRIQVLSVLSLPSHNIPIQSSQLNKNCILMCYPYSILLVHLKQVLQVLREIHKPSMVLLLLENNLHILQFLFWHLLTNNIGTQSIPIGKHYNQQLVLYNIPLPHEHYF